MTSFVHSTGREFDSGFWNRRLEGFAWGLFLIMLGVLWILPDRMVPADSWLIGAGLILLSLNIARAVLAIPIRGFTTVLGVAALSVGAASLLGVKVPILAILLMVFGLYVVFDTITANRRPSSVTRERP